MRARNWPGKDARHKSIRRAASAAAKRMTYEEAMRAGERLAVDTSDAYDTLFGPAVAPVTPDAPLTAPDAPVAPVSGAPPVPFSAPPANVAVPLPESRPPEPEPLAASPPPMPVTLLAWWPLRDQPGSALLGQADVRLGKSQILRGVGVWCRDGEFAAFAAPGVDWVDAEAHARFSDAVIQAVRAVWPGDLNK